MTSIPTRFLKLIIRIIVTAIIVMSIASFYYSTDYGDCSKYCNQSWSFKHYCNPNYYIIFDDSAAKRGNKTLHINYDVKTKDKDGFPITETQYLCN